jgi:hypothetical protein
MSTTNATMTVRSGFKDRRQAFTAFIAITLVAVAMVIAVGAALRGATVPAAPAVEGNALVHEMLRQHLLRENSVAPAVTAPDWFQRHSLAPAQPAPAELFRQHLLRENSTGPAAAPYADYGLRQRVVPAGTGYEDFGQRHRPAGDR